MLSPSDYNSAVPQFANGEYASNPINPLYIEEPTAVDYNRGVEPLQTLPAQWWNWFGKQFTARFNKLNIYVKNIFNELAQLLSLVNITPDGTEESPTVGQLKTMFQTEYPKHMALLMYPVGSLYWTGKAPNDGGDPNVLFGGTWVQIKGMFVFAKGDSGVLNATGGAKTVTLVANNLPTHTHTLSGSTSSEYAKLGKTTSPTGASSFSVVSNGGHVHGLSYRTQYQNNTAECCGLGSSSWFDGLGGPTSETAHNQAFGTSCRGKSFMQTAGAHEHTVYQATHSHTLSGDTGDNTTTNTPVDIMPPYIVKYCWERTE